MDIGAIISLLKEISTLYAILKQTAVRDDFLRSLIVDVIMEKTKIKEKKKKAIESASKILE